MHLADPDDIDCILSLRDDLARWLLDKGVQQWDPGEFPRQRLLDWVTRGWVHVHRRSGRIIGAVAVLDSDPVWPEDRPGAGYVHLLMVSRDHVDAGLGDRLLQHAEGVIRRRGCRLACLDAVASNEVLRRWYEHRGYRYVGTVRFAHPGAHDTSLYEKPLAGTALQ